MTTREPVQTNLVVGIILPLYDMQEEDIQALSDQLRAQMTIVYRQEIQRNLNLFRCQRLVTGPDERSQAWIDDKARKDAEGIARTYRRELSNEIRRIYTSNPRGNRYYYYTRLDAWAAKRTAYKAPSISLNTMTQARGYAQDRFLTENGIETKFAFVGPPPVCSICIRAKGRSPITRKQMKQSFNKAPFHVGCPHRWDVLIPTVIDCDTVWTG